MNGQGQKIANFADEKGDNNLTIKDVSEEGSDSMADFTPDVSKD